MLTKAQVEEHRTKESCWVIISGNVYDLTDFLDHHPGGSAIILRYAGQDATSAYEPLHPPGTLERYLSKENCKGPVLVDQGSVKVVKRKYKEGDPIPLMLCMNLDDFEKAARIAIPERAFVYFHSAAEDKVTFYRNRQDWSRISLRPRTLTDVAKVDPSRRIMGFQSSLPFFIAPAAMARLAHPDGELCLVRAAIKYGIPYCVSTYSSVPHEELASHVQPDKPTVLFFQLYVAKERSRTEALIRNAKKLGFKGLLITVDTAVGGKREEDELFQAQIAYEAGDDDVPRPFYASPGEEVPILRGAHSSTLNWRDLEWIRQEWGDAGPIYLKGIQCAEDAEAALRANVHGIYLSNHGGRQLDSGSSALRTLMEIRTFCPHVLERLEVYLDGGVRRGSDVIKALCLGATAVGLGRPFMYALGAYGTDGVVKAIQILSDEIESTMRLMGVTALDQLTPDHVNARQLENELPRRLLGFEARSRL
ncbi:hypothetical protein Z517_04132 [Fonsecaea pedrosoi CBS 271.37]|uniref:L-lactate dehydrogenase (cytochrome) n=1 Tax=Fonsecaea pedrosoi CBS 271.37 TaxID=1442368 RepID=A0A0D2H964_9EURO|nr:uncharacterized protein Z517_04132 [Fonsecaea pedrosoi CBS 271.37]KIW81109.1 hypothetical protein Z517_04132 [Fonsecaea pedrosoi CBS 271.37]